MSVDGSLDLATRSPPDLTSDRFAACIAIARETGRWDARTLELSRGEHGQLVWAEAWLSHLDEVYVTRGCRPFRGDDDAYIERSRDRRGGDIRGFLTASVPVWRPGSAPRPRPAAPGGRLPRQMQDRGERRGLRAVSRRCSSRAASPALRQLRPRARPGRDEAVPDVSSRAALAEQLAAERCLAGRILVAGLSKICSADISHIRPDEQFMAFARTRGGCVSGAWLEVRSGLVALRIRYSGEVSRASPKVNRVRPIRGGAKGRRTKAPSARADWCPRPRIRRSFVGL